MSMNRDAEILAGAAQQAGRRLLAETRDTRRAWEQLAMLLVQNHTPAQLAGALAAAALDAVLDAAPALDPAAVERAARELHADNYRNRDATTDAHAADMWPRLLDVERAEWLAKAERVLAAAGYAVPPREDFAAAVAAAARLARNTQRNVPAAATEPTGQTGPGWTYDREEDDHA